jgi:ribonuclease VapC
VSVVLDASSVLAMARGEPGGDRVIDHLDGGLLPAVNLAEVLGRYVREGGDPRPVAGWLAGLGCRFPATSAADADLAAAIHARELAVRDRPVLSLGDRLCLAVAMRLQLPVLTADRVWAELPLDVEVELLR